MAKKRPNIKRPLKRPKRSASLAKPKPPVVYPPFEGFSPDAVKFLNQLGKNNNRDWFKENKPRYEDVVLTPALSFIQDLRAPLARVTKHFTAIPKRSGGSLMRIYRDTRFSKDKTPYKTNIGIHLRHEVGKDIHAPGFYIHIEAKEVFIGAGIWHPDNTTLTQIRQCIDEYRTRWKRVRNAAAFKKVFDIHGDTLKRPPRGYDEEHPLIVDLKMKDHIGLARLEHKDLFDKKLIDKTIAKIKAAKPFVTFLCDALHLPV